MCPLTRNNLVRVETPSPEPTPNIPLTIEEEPAPDLTEEQLQYYESLGTHEPSSNEDTDTEDELFFRDVEEEE